MKLRSRAPFWEIVIQADGWLLNWIDRLWESSGRDRSGLLANAQRYPRVLATSWSPAWWDMRWPTTIRRKRRLQKDVGWKFMGSNPGARSKNSKVQTIIKDNYPGPVKPSTADQAQLALICLMRDNKATRNRTELNNWNASSSASLKTLVLLVCYLRSIF